MNRNKRLTYLIGYVLLFLGSAWLLFLYFLSANEGKIIISHDSGIYRESIQVTAFAYGGEEIYYTVDGAGPKEDMSNAFLYEEPLVLSAGELESTVYSYFFFTCDKDGQIEKLYERNYMIRMAEKAPFETKYVFSVFGSEEDLFSEEKGLFVRGEQFQEYMEANPDVDVLSTIIPANYLSEAEVPVYAAVFNSQGEEIIAQSCGLKIYGAVTRAKNQKSFRLIARTEYGDNSFRYPFLEKLVSDYGQTVIENFQRLSLHNSGNDNGYAFIRNALCGELARQSGFSDVLVSESAAVYINGKYQGIYWLQNAFDDRYFAQKYGEYSGEMAVTEGTMNVMDVAEAETPEEVAFAEEYNDFCTWLAAQDVQEEAVWQQVTETIDIENFARYMALEYYVSNQDWPENNVKVYRYAPSAADTTDGQGVFDGRYRYLLYDLDYGMGLKFLGWFGRGADTPTLETLMEQITFFGKCMEREEFRTEFVNQVMHLLNNSFSEANVKQTMAAMDSSRNRELQHMMNDTDILKNSLWEPDDITYDTAVAEMAKIIDFAEDRAIYVPEELKQVLGLDELFTLEVINQSRVSLEINGLTIEGSENAGYVGTYFQQIPLNIQAVNTPGREVTGYLVNGKLMEGSDIVVQTGETALTIEVLWEESRAESLTIKRYHTSGDEDYVVLSNNGTVPLNLVYYGLSDEEDDLLKGRLPERELAPGEEVTIYGGNYSKEMEKGRIQLSFSWNSEEPLILSHISGEIVEKK